jgi:hypothetical protein
MTYIIIATQEYRSKHLTDYTDLSYSYSDACVIEYEIKNVFNSFTQIVYVDFEADPATSPNTLSMCYRMDEQTRETKGNYFL